MYVWVSLSVKTYSVNKNDGVKHIVTAMQPCTTEQKYSVYS